MPWEEVSAVQLEDTFALLFMCRLCWGCIGQPFTREPVTDGACMQLPVEEAPVRGQ